MGAKGAPEEDQVIHMDSLQHTQQARQCRRQATINRILVVGQWTLP
jgi:hypothetical protein